MLALERIFTTVEQAKGPVCETCIPMVAATDATQADSLSKILLEQGIFHSLAGTCSICGAQGKTFRIASKATPATATGDLAALNDRLHRIEDQLRRLVAWNQVQSQSPQAVAVPTAAAPARHPRTPVYLGNNLALCWILDRFKFFVDSTDWSMTPHFLYEGCWEMNITNLFTKLIKPGNTVMDVGANFGFYTVVGADAVGAGGKVYAIEAGPNNFQILRRNIHINGFDGRVKAFHNAALNERKPIELFQQADYAGGHSVFVSQPDSPKYQRAKVDGVPIDELIPEGTVDVIKMDVEGCEALAFEGMTKLLERSRNVKIIMEWAPFMIRQTKRDPAEFLKFTRAMGFDAWRVTDDSRIGRFNEADLDRNLAIHTLYLARPLA